MAAERSTRFGELTIRFDERVLVPRAWTAAQSRWAADLLGDSEGLSRTVLELCCGAGHIGLLALALGHAPNDRLVAVDVNPVACEFARRNAADAGFGHRVEVREGRIDDVLAPGERFDLVIADPPWVPRSQVAQFPDDPELAIDGGDDGLTVAWSCLRAAQDHLGDGGSLLLQLGSSDQVERVNERLHVEGLLLAVDEVRRFDDRGVLVRFTR